MSRPLVLGHRGAPALARENTVAAFRAALDEGADGVELDVQCTADGALVLHHDTVVSGRPVHHRTLAELRAALGPLDTLDDALAALPAAAWVFVEIKRQISARERDVVERVCALVAGRDHTWVGSFDPLVAKLVPAPIRRGWIVDRETLGPGGSLAADVDVVSLEHPLATGPLLDTVQAQTLAWPVDAEDDLDRCFARFPRLGGVITKHPARARARWEAR